MPKRTGGAYLAHGSYGCTFTPPIPCSQPPIVGKTKKAAKPGAATAPVEQIGKVFLSPTDAATEFTSADLLRRIDPKKEVFLYSDEMCTIRRDDALRQSGAHECYFLGVAPRYLTQLIQRHGGLDFKEYVLATHRAHGPIARADLAPVLLNLFSGIQRLIKLGYVHQDIKGPNIVVRPGSDASRAPELRLIDFGTLNSFADFYDPVKNFLLNVPNYAVNPPEYRIIAIGDRSRLTHTFIKDEQYIIMEYVPVSQRAVVAAEYDINADSDPSFRAYVDAMTRKMAAARLADMRQSRAAEKADLWSVGYTLILTHQYLKPAADEPPEAVRLFRELVTGLMKLVPDERLSAAEAIRLTKRLIRTKASLGSPDRAQAEYYREIFASPATPPVPAPSAFNLPPTPIQEMAEAQMYSHMTVPELRQRDTFKMMSKTGKWKLRKADLVAALAKTKRAQKP